MAPLHWFLFMNECTEGVKALLEAGANVNAICWTEEGGLIAPMDIVDKLGERRKVERDLLVAAGAKRYADMDESERAKNSPPQGSGPKT
mmetsp:Transcript_33779/g.52598  ORF Transcript_33779/g.52598 Transcript_33779/m.52598 type:complete len:89 (+) Transcript_33779:452-718(+)